MPPGHPPMRRLHPNSPIVAHSSHRALASATLFALSMLVGPSCGAQRGARAPSTTRVRIVMESTTRGNRATAAILQRAARRLARTAERWSPGLGVVTIRVGGFSFGEGTFSMYSGDADPLILMPLSGARRVERAMLRRRRTRFRAESALVGIGLHELGHAAAFRYGLEWGDRGEQFADDYLVVLATRTHHPQLIGLVADYLDEEDAQSPSRPGEGHLANAERTRRLRCLMRAAAQGKGSCLGMWKDVERDMRPYLRQ